MVRNIPNIFGDFTSVVWLFELLLNNDFNFNFFSLIKEFPILVISKS